MSLLIDPVDPLPTGPLLRSYTYHSPISAYTRATYQLPSEEDLSAAASIPARPASEDAPTEQSAASGSGTASQEQEPSAKGKEKERWVMGIDEAGRGPVLGTSRRQPPLQSLLIPLTRPLLLIV